MSKNYRAVPADELTKAFAPARKARIAARAAELIAGEMALRNIRTGRRITQEQVALRIGWPSRRMSRGWKRGPT